MEVAAKIVKLQNLPRTRVKGLIQAKNKVKIAQVEEKLRYTYDERRKRFLDHRRYDTRFREREIQELNFFLDGADQLRWWENYRPVDTAVFLLNKEYYQEARQVFFEENFSCHPRFAYIPIPGIGSLLHRIRFHDQRFVAVRTLYVHPRAVYYDSLGRARVAETRRSKDCAD